MSMQEHAKAKPNHGRVRFAMNCEEKSFLSMERDHFTVKHVLLAGFYSRGLLSARKIVKINFN